ncbi:MAG: HlyD family efflux transporter periplasmic adaptor subunit [Chitinivibrionales bacterium]|nr:HlyD family efflux transporter periplasmic adaptor subunit [Chitinivibrionales bacterium]MBD3397285.1 HlyD family efflux transporter periplasmic adaptor subunit [Chitinivibrionales bacterium]
MKKFVIAAVIVAAAFGLMAMLSSLRKDQPRARPEAFVRTVLTRTARYDTVRPSIRASGRVRALQRVSLAPEVSGIVLATPFRLRKGMSFSRGQVLMKIDNRQAGYAYQSALSDLRNALAGFLAELKTDVPDAYGRWETFFNHLEQDDLPALPRVPEGREKLLATRHNIYKLYYAAQTHGLSLARHTLYAPFDGTVEESMIDPASMARAGAAVAVIARTDIVEIELALAQAEARLVRAGAPARVSVEGIAGEVAGEVHRVSDVLDERMQTVAVFVRVAHAAKQGVKSGSYATVDVEGEPLPHAFSLGRKAIHDKDRVYVIESDTLAEKTVDIAYRGITTAYVRGGVDDGAVIVAEPLQDAVLGMAVQSVEDARRKAAGAGGDMPGGQETGRGKGRR